MSISLIQGTALEATGVLLMARILGDGGFPITQASLSSLTYEVGYKPKPAGRFSPAETGSTFTPVRTQGTTSLTITDVIFDTLQTGPELIVTAASPATSENTTLYVDPLEATIPAGTLLTFLTGTANVTSKASTGSRSLTCIVSGTITEGESAGTGILKYPPQWRMDAKGYNFLFQLPASALPQIPLDDTYSPFPKPRFYVVSIKATPDVGEVFGWEYQIETDHWLFGKWGA